MDIHEFQAKHLFEAYGISVPPYRIVSCENDVDEALDELAISTAVVKVQVHAGGRGKAGGVKIGKTRQEIKALVAKMIGMKIVNNQTGPQGVTANQIMIAELTDIAKEYYMGIVIDRAKAQIVMMVSPEGGMDIEEVAEKHPEKIFKIAISLDGKIADGDLERLASFMKWEDQVKEQGIDIAKKLALLFVEKDGSMLEINPLVETPDGDIVALDAKFSVDDNALFRQKEIAAMYDPTQKPTAEVIAHDLDLAYIALDGTVGCMVNGAGLAMATMDIIQHFGKDKGVWPANFLDVGGGADKEKVAKSFKIILSDPQVKAILVNIFGGIMKCDVIAEGIIAAVKEQNIHVPLVVRLEGTNVDKGKKLLETSGLKIITATDLSDAAKKVVACGNTH
ncbi:MAG: ADP-forming succinate--CoA ligase subunit beta [Chlamydiae bacterium]|nr:ADP-forming succinate--CoA ligase subunit beta [Chlamydiota bacterium]